MKKREMRFRFNWFVVAVACVAAMANAACVKSTELNDNEITNEEVLTTGDKITFYPEVTDTRGISYGTLPSLYHLSIWCNNVDNDNSDYFATNPATFKITNNGATLNPEGLEVYYWPADGSSLLFRACYPDIKSQAGSNDKFYYYESDGRYYIHQPESVKEQVDFLVADQTTVENGAIVPLAFDHKMARVQFGAAYKNSDGDDAEYSVVVTKVTIKGIYNYYGTITDGVFKWGSSYGDPYASVADSSVLSSSEIMKSTATTGATNNELFTTVSNSYGMMFFAPQPIPEVTVDYTVDGVAESITFNTNSVTATEGSSIILYFVLPTDDSGTGSIVKAANVLPDQI